MVTDSSAERTPRFKVGDKVRLVGPGPLNDKQGQVAEVIQSPLDYVHRYNVTLSDGTSSRCFGFELELLQPFEECA